MSQNCAQRPFMWARKDSSHILGNNFCRFISAIQHTGAPALAISVGANDIKECPHPAAFPVAWLPLVILAGMVGGGHQLGFLIIFYAAPPCPFHRLPPVLANRKKSRSSSSLSSMIFKSLYALRARALRSSGAMADKKKQIQQKKGSLKKCPKKVTIFF